MARIALVTGGTRGIGAATAEALQKAGYKVAATYHGNDEAAQEFTQRTGIPHFKFDVSNFDACQTGVAEVENKAGPVDILVNNAGITKDAFFHKMTLEQWNEVIHTNLNSAFNVTRQVIGGMRKRGFGRIISISSINGLQGQIGQTNYCAAKASVIGFTKALALESATKGITVNAVAPGYTDTDMVRAVAPEVLEKIIAKIPVKHLGKPEDIARMIVFLAGDDAGFITGATFNVNGGQYLA